MELLQDLTLVGLSHRTASVALRERYAVRQADTDALLRELVQGTIEEAAVLSTCNRTEVLVLAHEEDPVPAIKRAVFRNLEEDCLYIHRGLHAIMHVFRVSGGLDSLVLGESEILGQLKRATELARDAGTLGRVLQPLMGRALKVGKRVRAETDVGQGTLSMARVGVDVARHVFGDLKNVNALIVGAGETGLLVAKHLASEGVKSLTFANRSIERAELVAAALGARAVGLDALAEATQAADLVVVAVDAGTTVLEARHFDRRVLARRDRPALVVDLSVPRGVAADVGKLDQVLCYDLDDLEPIVEKNKKQRGVAGDEAGSILVAEVHKFLALRTYAAFSPAITELRTRFDLLREEVLDRITVGKAEPREIELAHELARKLLDISLDQMKEGAKRSRSEEALDREYQRFLKKL